MFKVLFSRSGKFSIADTFSHHSEFSTELEALQWAEKRAAKHKNVTYWVLEATKKVIANGVTTTDLRPATFQGGW